MNPMNGDHTTELQGLLDRLLAGDDSARQQLISRAYQKLRRLAAKMLGESFPRLNGLHPGESRARRRACPGYDTKSSAPPAASASRAATTWLMRTRPATRSGSSRSGSSQKRPKPYQHRTPNA